MATAGQQPTKVVISAPSSTPLTGIEILSTSVPFPTITTTELGLGTLAGSVVYAGDPQWGIIGDGVADDAPAINTMSAAAVAGGATKIVFPSGKTFRVTSVPIRPRQNLIWDGQGSTFITGVGFPVVPGGMFYNNTQATKTFIGNITGTGVTAPTDQLTLSSVAGLSVGNWIGVLLGTDPFDNSSPYYGFVAQVTNIAGNVITFDWVIAQNINFNAYTYIPKDPVSSSIAVPSTPTGSGPLNFRAVYLLGNDMALNLTFRDMVLMGDPNGNIEGGMSFQWGANIRCENIVGNSSSSVADMGAGLITAQFVRNLRIDKAYLGYNNNTSGQASKGKMFSFATCDDVVVTNHFSKNIKNGIAVVEDGCTKITFMNGVDIFNQDTMNTGIQYGAYALLRGNAEFINPTVFSSVPSSTPLVLWAFNNGGDGDWRVTGTFKWRGPLFYLVSESANKLNCIFDFDDPATGYARIDFTSKNHYSLRIPLSPSMFNVTYYFPGGMSDVDIFTSANVPAGSVSGFNFANGTAFLDAHAQLVPGKVVNIGGPLPSSGPFTSLGTNWGGIAYYTTNLTSITIFTTAAAQTDGNFLGVVVRVPRVLESNLGVLGANSGFNSYALTDDQMCAVLNGTPQRIVENGLLVGALPSPSAANKGERRIVTDATVTTFASIVAGTGGNTVPVYSDGTNWRIG